MPVYDLCAGRSGSGPSTAAGWRSNAIRRAGEGAARKLAVPSHEQKVAVGQGAELDVREHERIVLIKVDDHVVADRRIQCSIRAGHSALSLRRVPTRCCRCPLEPRFHSASRASDWADQRLTARRTQITGTGHAYVMLLLDELIPISSWETPTCS